jgi:hypothetical protein
LSVKPVCSLDRVDSGCERLGQNLFIYVIAGILKCC